jgi:hypothetical protein
MTIKRFQAHIEDEELQIQAGDHLAWEFVGDSQYKLYRVGALGDLLCVWAICLRRILERLLGKNVSEE